MVMKELLLELPKKCEHPPTNTDRDVFPAVAFRVDRESDGNTFAFARVYVNTAWWLMIVCYHRLTAKRKKKENQDCICQRRYAN